MMAEKQNDIFVFDYLTPKYTEQFHICVVSLQKKYKYYKKMEYVLKVFQYNLLIIH